MELNYNFISFLDAVGFIQGLTLGSIILIMNRNRHKSTFYLGLFLIVFSLKLLHYIANGIALEKYHPSLFLVPFNFSWLLFPLFFIYCQKISFFSDQKTNYWVLVPGILSFIAQLIIFLMPYQTRLIIAQSVWYEFLFTYLGIFYSWSIGLWNLVMLNRHKLEIQNYYSLVESKELNWAKTFLIYSLLSSLIIHILYYYDPDNYYFRLIFAIFDLIAISWVSVFGLQQQNTHTVLSENKFENNFGKVEAQIQNEEAKPDMADLKRTLTKIDHIMENEKLFLKKDLTIIDIAKKLQMHPKKISNAINTITNQNFNIYVNNYRVDEAKRLLKNFNKLNLSIDGIGNESGFKSKSAFYGSFKKVTDITPTTYKIRFDKKADK
ncbi:helix-turn-helix domain-containing protein [Flagellimonas lutaonensis]|uniref:HTH araC/xylS-type domain-containing protein n=1 Tax=Flagellimonas lutaonensis TaxID=516051 RepID=A0A0D5YUG2_9FLAO|nr:AraC family transcriptional regulator [Allomuricauda lutaonensis]AKA35880.1 hypothetical protein VC82_2289 [Allomuricauda lutaonensis]